MPGFLSGPINGLTDRSKGKGTVSSSWLSQVGKSAAQAAAGGSIYSNLSVAGIGNGADVTADVLMSCSLPANIFDIFGRCITLQAFGTVAATSATKTVAFVWGGGSLSQSICQYTTTNTGTWQVYVQLFKQASNVQIALFQADATGTVATLLGSASGRSTLLNTGGSETDTAAITMSITGQCNSSVANVVKCNGFIVDGYN